MPFCSKCGKEIAGGSQFCSGCGQPISVQPAQQPAYQQPAQQPVYQQPAQQPVYQQPPYQQAYAVTPGDLLQILSGKVKTEAVVWVIVASLQVFIGLWNVIAGFLWNAEYYRNPGTVNIVVGVIVLLVAVLNYTWSSKAFKYSRDVLLRPVGIVAKYTPVGGLVGNLIYNLLAGGLVGAVGPIFGFVTRSFVMNNRQAFNAIEASYSGNTIPQI